MSGREDSRRRQTTSQGSIFVDTSQIALLRCGDRGASAADVVVHTTGLDELGGDASSACRQRRKVALLAYKLQMNSQERCRRHQHHQQLCQAILCGRFVSYILYLCTLVSATARDKRPVTAFACLLFVLSENEVQASST